VFVLGFTAPLGFAQPIGAVTTPPLRWQVLDAGDEVRDIRYKLIWRRCVEGMHWAGHFCAGVPKRMSYADALALVSKMGKDTGQKWRLPHVPELRALVVDADRAAPDAARVDPELFPQAPAGWYWTGSSTVGAGAINSYNYGNVAKGLTSSNANHLAVTRGWAYHGQTTEAVGNVIKREALYVRWVRPDF
jgi:hypothetical protein